MTWSPEELKNRFEELVSFLTFQGHSEERARQIAGNHAAAVAEELEKSKGVASDAKEKEAPQDQGATETAESDPSTEQEGAIPQTPQAKVKRRG